MIQVSNITQPSFPQYQHNFNVTLILQITLDYSKKLN